MKNTTIGWTDHTINFWWGCTEVSPACVNCYARGFAKYVGFRVFGHSVEWGRGKQRGYRGDAARAEAFALNKQAAKKGTRCRVFVNSMSDWLDEEVPVEWLAHLLETIFSCPCLDFQLLTKRLDNFWPRLEAVQSVREDGPFLRWLCKWGNHLAPMNVWIGTTVEDQLRADERIPHLLSTPARVRFLSCEPLVGPIDLNNVPFKRGTVLNAWDGNALTIGDIGGADFSWTPRHMLHWVIAGGESGASKKHRFTHPDWFRSLRDQCHSAGVPFFFKQWGDFIPCNQAPNKVITKRPGWIWLSCDGTPTKTCLESDQCLMVYMGAKRAGNMLDGKQHEAFPILEDANPCG